MLLLAELIAAKFLFSAEFRARLNNWIVSRVWTAAEARPAVSISNRDGQIRVQLADGLGSPAETALGPNVT